jgi:uncharacterized membrane protein YjdF
MNPKELICPVSNERVNERVVRCNALFTIILAVTGLYFQSVLILLLLATDFFIRAFTSLKTSPVSFVSQNVIEMLGLERKPIDKAPKIFAARLGFLMSFLLVILVASGSMLPAYVIGGILTLFATLELVIGFCAGCFIFSYVVLPLTNGNKN